jgi:predicted nucleic acid-binding protein
VEPLARRAQAARCTICDLEVGFSARNGTEWDQLTAALEAFTPVETTAAHIQRAIQVQRLLAMRSKRGRKIPDLLIAATAEEQGMVVLHYDTDFDLISEVTGQPVEWVSPPGSIS